MATQDDDLSLGVGSNGPTGAQGAQGGEEEVYIDMSQAKDFAPLPEMAYEAVCEEKPVVFESEEKKTPCFKWEFTLTGAGLPPDQAKEVQGRKLIHRTPIAGAGAGLAEPPLKALGVAYKVEKDPAGKILGIRMKPGEVLGKRLILHVKQHTYTARDGTKRIGNNIAGFSSLPQSGAQAAAQVAAAAGK